MTRSYSTIWIVAALALAAFIMLVISAAPVALGQLAGEDPTAWQGTVDASVNNLFTATAEAPRNAMLTQAVGTAFVDAQTATVQALAAAAATDTPVPPSPTTEATEPTPRPEIFPTDTVADMRVAYQEFEHGYMYWLSPNRQIWIAQTSPNDPNIGTWFCYVDTFQDGEQETDPNLVPPEGEYQPRRGFGKLWRNTPGIQEGMGWAITPEQELQLTYQYVPGGYVENEVYFTGPGAHHLNTASGRAIIFQEETIMGDCIGGTWHLAG